MPASALNSVVLPVLGLPTSARVGVRVATIVTRKVRGRKSGGTDADLGGLGPAEAEAIILQANLHRVAQGCEADDLDLATFEQTHLVETLNDGVLAVDGLDRRTLACLQLIERFHGRV